MILRALKRQNTSNQQRLFTFLLIFFLLVVLTTIVILASVPPISRDALTHHLYVPRLYLEHGSIYEIPSIPFSYYPMSLDLLYMIPLYLGNDIVPKYIHFIFALLTAGLIYYYLNSRLNQIYALIGCIFFLTVPIIVKLSIAVYVDLGLMFFTTASLLLLIRWINTNNKTRYLILSGICCGLGLGVKYNGLIALFLLTLFTPILYIRAQKKPEKTGFRAVYAGITFMFFALIVFSPWLIRNYNWTGNPIYPLYDSVVQKYQKDNDILNVIIPKGTQETGLVKELTSRGSGVFAKRKILYEETWWQTILLPVRFFYEGKDNNPRYFDGKLHPFLLCLPIFAFWRRETKDRLLILEKRTLLAFSVLFFFFTFFQDALRIRYILPIVPPLVILSIFGLQKIVSTISKSHFPNHKLGKQFLCFFVLATLFTPNIGYIFQQFRIVQPFTYLNGNISKHDYISRFNQEYPVIQIANNLTQPETKILCIYLGKRGYYMNFTPIFDNPLQKGLLSKVMNSRPAITSLRSQLLEKGIHYLLIRNDLTQNWIHHLDNHEQKIILRFFQTETIQLINNGYYSLFQIKL